MKIARSGSAAFHGVYEIQFTSPKFSWNAGEKLLQVRQGRVEDFSSNARHDYALSITLEELSQLIAVAADAAMQEPATFVGDMSKVIADLTRLQAVAAGVVRA